MLFFDMDGVVATYDRGGYDFTTKEGPEFLKPGYFLNREPDERGVQLLKDCLKNCPNDTYIITGIPKAEISIRNQIIFDKMRWLTQVVPEFDIGTKFIAPTDSKMNFIEWIRGTSIGKNDVLIDDYNPNLFSWSTRGGTAIKFLNGINSEDSWIGPFLRQNSDSLFYDLMHIVYRE